MIFTKKNYLMMIGGILLIILGFIVLSGGGSPDPVNVFTGDEMFSFGRLWVAPILILAGLSLEGVAIMWRDKKTEK